MLSGLHASRKNEVPEPTGDVTEGTDTPAQSIIAESVERNPPPLESELLGAHRLIEDPYGATSSNGLEDITKDVSLHTQVSEARKRTGLHKNRLETVRHFVAFGALVVDQIPLYLFLVECQVLRGLEHGHAELLYDIGTVDPTLPKEAEFNKLQPLFSIPQRITSSR